MQFLSETNQAGETNNTNKPNQEYEVTKLKIRERPVSLEAKWKFRGGPVSLKAKWKFRGGPVSLRLLAEP